MFKIAVSHGCKFFLLFNTFCLGQQEKNARYEVPQKRPASHLSPVKPSPATSKFYPKSLSIKDILRLGRVVDNKAKNSPDFGSTMKRKVLSKCRKVMASLSDVSERYEESIACVLGNSFIFGGDDEKGQVRDTISEVVDIAMEAKSSESALSIYHIAIGNCKEKRSG